MSFDHSYHFAGFKPLNEPVVRLIDFHDDMVVRQVSTMARRLWLLNPPLSDEELVEKPALMSCFQAMAQEIGNGISHDPAEARWDHQHWLSHTNLALLNPAVQIGVEPYDTRSVNSPWRVEIYGIYKHVFIDLWRKMKEAPKTDHLGRFDPSKEESVAVCMLQSVNKDVDKTTFDTDTFLYPVWVNPKAKVTFSVDGVVGKEHVWADDEPSAWTTGLWLKAGKEITTTTEMDLEGDETGVAAVFMLGHCEEGQLVQFKEEFRDKSTDSPNPTGGQETTEEESGDTTAEFVPEADHLARAIFLKAGDAVARCTFDDSSSSLDAVPDGTPVDEPDTPEDGSIYKPFPNDHSIRVLTVEPGSADSELQTSLKVVDLESKPQYEAMSYTWGDPKDKTSLRVQQFMVEIPRNLEDALKRLRHPDRRRYIWADAVCINQDDIFERGQQVSIMRNIYLQAQEVLVWLGKDEEKQAETAFTAVCDIVRSWRPPNKPLRFSSYKEAFEPRKDRLSIDEAKWKALQALFQNTYFTRFWIIQELVLAGGPSATIIWGDHHISWGLIGISAAWLLTRGWPTNPGRPISAAYNAFLIYILPLARRSAISSFSKLDLSAVLATTMGKFTSTDPRDRIFALLGMPFSGNDPGKGTLVHPDYTADVHSVYLTATKRMLTQDSNLRLLSAVQHGLEIDTSSPSWVPKWDQSLFAEPLALRQEHGYYANAGELFFPNEDSFGQGGESLILTGLKVTAITEASEPFTAGNISLSLPDELKGVMLAMLGYLNDQEQQVRASWSATLEKNQIPGFNNPEEQAQIVGSAEGMRMAATTGIPGKYGLRKSTEILNGERMGIDNLGEFLLYWRERCTWDVDALKHEDFKAFWEAVEKDGSPYTMERALCSMNAFIGRRVFRCEDGKFGLGPAAMRPGDIITVLFGAIVPYVLRPLDDDGRRWALVGECIIPMLMQGQAVEAAGLLAEGTYSREEDGMLKLKPPQVDDQDPRFHREVGKHGVMRFEIK